MPHLHTDRLAALGDERPTDDEVAHLAGCDDCARERDAYVALGTMAAAERDALGLPLTRWDAIAEALHRTDAIADIPSGRVPRLRARRWTLQVAAGLLLVAGGMMAGRVSAGAGPLPRERGATVATAASALPTTRLAADTAFVSVEDARQAQQHSELLYQQATSWIAQHDNASDDTPVAYRSRLAALDRVISTTREAMRQAPHDPVINGYYLTTLGQREATLRQLNTALPATLRVNSF
ncbi:MAG: hypothetical protein H0W68_08115 [Gemmatimonadaceae bacterium]|nr:hypothetical protein [Gemmatimonadaceae bacterium]